MHTVSRLLKTVVFLGLASFALLPGSGKSLAAALPDDIQALIDTVAALPDDAEMSEWIKALVTEYPELAADIVESASKKFPEKAVVIAMAAVEVAPDSAAAIAAAAAIGAPSAASQIAGQTAAIAKPELANDICVAVAAAAPESASDIADAIVAAVPSADKSCAGTASAPETASGGKLVQPPPVKEILKDTVENPSDVVSPTLPPT